MKQLSALPFLLMILIFVLPSVTFGQNTALFTRNLKLGDTGADVKLLQELLNKDTKTQIRATGPGSPGLETSYFGILTQKAVEKFQIAQKDTIFLSAGIVTPTGFVGPSTRNALEKMVSTKNSTPIEAHSKTSSRSLLPSNLKMSLMGVPKIIQQEKKVRLYRAFPYQVAPKSEIELSGEGFDKTNNTVYIGEGYSVTNIESEDGKNVRITLPSHLKTQKYEVWVENSHGSSKNAAIPIRFLLTDTPKDPPNITSSNPVIVTSQSTFILIGSGFTNSGNNIYTSLGNTLNIPSSDGKSLSISVSSLSQLIKIKNKDTQGLKVPVSIVVQNENGTQQQPFVMYFQL